MTLLRQQWRSDRGTLLTWCVVVAFLTWMMAGLWEVLASTGALVEYEQMLKAMPPFVQAMVGKGNLNLFGAYVAGMEYGGVMSFAFIIFVAAYVPGLLTKEVEQRTSEFLLSLPVTRRSVIGVRWLGLVANLTALTLVQWIVLIGVAGPEAQPVRYFWASLNMLLLYVEAGTLVLLATVFIDDHSRAVGVSAALVTFLFFYNSMTESATGIVAAMRKALPFARFDPTAIIATGRVPGADIGILAVGSLVLLFLAVKAFDSKQVAS